MPYRICPFCGVGTELDHCPQCVSGEWARAENATRDLTAAQTRIATLAEQVARLEATAAQAHDAIDSLLGALCDDCGRACDRQIGAAQYAMERLDTAAGLSAEVAAEGGPLEYGHRMADARRHIATWEQLGREYLAFYEWHMTADVGDIIDHLPERREQINARIRALLPHDKGV